MKADEFAVFMAEKKRYLWILALNHTLTEAELRKRCKAIPEDHKSIMEHLWRAGLLRVDVQKRGTQRIKRLTLTRKGVREMAQLNGIPFPVWS